MPRLTILILALLPFASSARAEAPLPVEFVAVERTELIFDAALTGTIAAQDSVDMGFRQGGRITEVLVHEGGRVSKGQALARTDPLQRALEDTIIRAPTDAIVISRKAEPGQIVGAAQAVLSLASATGREAVFQTADTPLLRDAIGAPVSLSGIDFPELRMTAHVTEIAPLVDPSTGSVTVRAEIEDAPTTVSLLGAAVRGAVHYPAGSGIAVPWTALTAAQGKPAVWLVGDANRVSLAPVQIERFTNGTVILKDGVKPGQIVVGAGAQRLYPGREVTDAGTAAEEE